MIDRRPVTHSAVRTALLLALCLPATVYGQADPQNAPVPAVLATPVPATHREPRAFDPTEFNLSVMGGRGLIREASPYPLDSGKIGVAGTVMNFDRNPGDVDFFEYGFQVAVGLPARTEVFLRASPVLRTNSVVQDPYGFPIPPLDLFVDTYPSEANRPGPHFLYAQEVPFKSYYVPTEVIDPPGHGAFSQSSGDIIVGGKVNLLSEDRDDRLGLGVRASLTIPTEKPAYNDTVLWRKRAGVSGKNNVSLDLLA